MGGFGDQLGHRDEFVYHIFSLDEIEQQKITETSIFQTEDQNLYPEQSDSDVRHNFFLSPRSYQRILNEKSEPRENRRNPQYG